MHPKAQEFITKLNDAKTAEYQEQKSSFLMDMELYDTIPNPNSEEQYTAEYPEWDAALSCYCKRVPIDVSDEEYEQMLQAVGRSSAKPKPNPIAAALKVIAWVLIAVAALAGVLMMSEGSDYMLTMGLVMLVSGLVSGIIFLGFGEIISLLQRILDKK